MDPRELNHLFEQMSPAPEQEEAILARLQAPEKAVKNPSRRWKKSVFVLTAAAAMTLACAAAAFSALDPRLLSFFQRTPQDTEPLGEGVVEVNQSHTYENGWTISVRQALADRYSLTALVEVTAPEGTALDQEHHNYYFDLSSQLLPEAENAAGVGGWRSGSTLLADDDPTDNQLTFLWYRSPTSYLEAETETFTGRTAVLSPSRFWSDVPDTLLYWKTDFPLEEWSCTVDLPAEDSGREVPSGQTVLVGEDEMEVTQLYFSPISCALTLQGEEHDSRMWGPIGLSSLMEETSLTLLDGSTVPMGQLLQLTYNQDTGRAEAVFQLERITDPERVVSVTVFGGTIPVS